MESFDAGRRATTEGIPARARGSVLSLVGAGRSGSTVLSSVLGEVPGFFDAGELRWLWSRDLPQQRPCGCGLPPADCPVWSGAVEQAFGIPPHEQSGRSLTSVLDPVVTAQRDTTRLRNRRALLAGADGRRPVTEAQATLSDATVSMLRALLDVTGATTVIDASKRPQEAAVLAATGAFDHYVVHIVRDPRAVVHSWSRSKPLPEFTGKAAMGPRSMRRTLMRWWENAVGAEALRHRIPPDRWLFLRYEDFAQRPRESVRQVLELVGDAHEPPVDDQRSVVLGTNHTLSGNPDRFRSGPVVIRPDDRWRTGMSRRDRAVVQAATMPFLLRYGYPLRVASPASEA
ncbi:sulfotransferase [Nocardioides caldifontis]|uniref:sulfotransferase n=1 Tax=Nocardioides caldifontis TaxID=2588938 RepID=UPI001396AE48|nr:sulfotransferase [Nocardioides caldifontis]